MVCPLVAEWGPRLTSAQSSRCLQTGCPCPVWILDVAAVDQAVGEGARVGVGSDCVLSVSVSLSVSSHLFSQPCALVFPCGGTHI